MILLPPNSSEIKKLNRITSFVNCQVSLLVFYHLIPGFQPITTYRGSKGLLTIIQHWALLWGLDFRGSISHIHYTFPDSSSHIEIHVHTRTHIHGCTPFPCLLLPSKESPFTQSSLKTILGFSHLPFPLSAKVLDEGKVFHRASIQPCLTFTILYPPHHRDSEASNPNPLNNLQQKKSLHNPPPTFLEFVERQTVVVHTITSQTS